MPRFPFSAESTTPFEVGPFEVRYVDSLERLRQSQTPSKNTADGHRYHWHATSPGADLVIGYGLWDNGDRGVEPVRATGGNDAFRSLGRGSLRFSIRPLPQTAVVRGRGPLVCAELAQGRARPNNRANAYKATEPELDEWAGLSVRDLVVKLGAVEFGTAGDVLGVDHKRMNYCCVVFPKGDARVPIAAFVATRALPLLNGATVS